MADLRSQLPSDTAAYLDAVEEKLAAYEEATVIFEEAEVQEQSAIFVQTVRDVIPRYLILAHSFSAPAPNEVVIVFKVLASKLQEISTITDKNTTSDGFQALMSIKNAAEALNWVTVSPKPANCVSEAYDGCLYYANRVSKDKGEDGKKWVKSLAQLLNAIKAYIIDYHSAGLIWKGSTKCPANLREADITTLMSALNLNCANGGVDPSASSPSSNQPNASESDSSPYFQEMNTSLKDLMEKSRSLGDVLQKIMEIFVNKIALQLIPKYLSLAESHKAPPQSEYPQVFKEMIDAVNEIVSMANKADPRHKQSHLLQTAKSAAESFNWVVMPGKPDAFVKENHDSTLFFGNRAIKSGGDLDKQWVQSLSRYFKDLQQFLKDFYPSGLVWKGKEALSASSVAKAGAGPPPPPAGAPPPPPAVDTTQQSNNDGEDNRAQLFSELNKGTDITKGLKKVTKDMQTHKNPELRAGCKVPAAVEKKTGKAADASKPAPQAAAKPPKMALEMDKKWIIENYQNDSVTVEITDIKHTVYVFNCKGTTITIKNKVNSISMDSCVKCGIVFDDLLSSVDLVNCKSVQLQAFSKMPLLNIDKTDGIQVYLSNDCLECEIVTAKSSEMNVLVPQPDGDFAEFPIPEQFRTVYNPKSKKLDTTCTDSLG